MTSLNRRTQVQQFKAWSYYGFPTDKSPTYNGRRVASQQPIGEAGYVIGWHADQMSRMGWGLLIDGKKEWKLDLPDGTVVRSMSERELEQEPEAGLSHAEASAKVLSLIGWGPGTVREIDTNLFVAGEFDFLAEDDSKWHVVSVVDPDRNDLISAAKHRIRGLWPHPADPSRPDAPLFRVLPILEEMDWLSRLSRSQVAQRVALRGIIGIADKLSAAGGGDFWEEFQQALAATMEDPTNVAPMALRGSESLVEPSGNGMKGFSWVIPKFPADQRVDEKMQALIQRLAYGLPIPPEILLGLQAQSRATAYQVEENSYRAHIEPPAWLVAKVATQALSILIPGKQVQVVPDPSDLLARRHSVQDVKDAWDRGLVSAAYVREVLDIPETSAADAEDLELLMMIEGKQDPETDPANVAAQPAVTASVGGSADRPLTTGELADLGDKLAEIDHTLMMELAGATVQATDRAREKVGARARTFEGLRKAIGRDVPNSQVVATIGLQVINDTGVPVHDLVMEALSFLGQWWAKRALAAQKTVQAVLGADAPTRFDEHDVKLSVDLLMDLCAEHVVDTFESEEALPLSAQSRLRVLTILGGGD